MKKIVVTIAIASLCMAGAAFAADNSQAASESSAKPNNGITYFDLGPATDCQERAETMEQEKPFNGITAFEMGQQGSGARGSCAGQTVAQPASMSYNGITVF
ncbi:MAG: hypothetical protein A2078_15715 [Nitrospirae bacterium GWC2_57_9]|nr:MAG: hypothetical protein A2078_15715 [Nitrospirae bacterium GWC2_57_9]